MGSENSFELMITCFTIPIHDLTNPYVVSYENGFNNDYPRLCNCTNICQFTAAMRTLWTNLQQAHQKVTRNTTWNQPYPRILLNNAHYLVPFKHKNLRPKKCLYISWQHGSPSNGSMRHGCHNLTCIQYLLTFVLHISYSGTPNCHPLRSR